MPSIRTALIALLVLVPLLGCGGVRRGNVAGKVRFKGQPLPSGKVTFISQEGSREVFSAWILEGNYQVANVPEGPVLVTVATYKPTSSFVMPPGGMVPMRPSDAEEKAPPPPLSRKYVQIPSRYAQPGQADLSYSVRPGDQTHDIELTP